jgi:cell division protein FtsI (penicillin-binding protein 3)
VATRLPARRSVRMTTLGALIAVGLTYTLGSFTRLALTESSEESGAVTLPERGRLLARDGMVLASGPLGKRVYPYGVLAAQVVGFSGTDRGLEGMEFFQDAVLASGKDVSLTLDLAVQATAEGALRDVVKYSEAQAASAVVIEVGTGRVLAAASYPTFDPNDWRAATGGAIANRAFLYEFEPGSVVKALVAAALVNTGRVTADSRVNAPNSRLVGGHRINDVVRHPDVLSLTGVLRYSSNVGISRLAEEYLGPRLLHHYLDAFGFGQAPGISGTAAAAGRLRNLSVVSTLEQATAAFGQGLSTTTLGLATAFSVLANDGKLVTPSLLVTETRPKVKRRVITAAAAAATRAMLSEASQAALPNPLGLHGYCSTGKTGTAQVAIAGGYSAEIYESVFAGYFPCERPRAVVAVEVYGGRRFYQGSQVAAPAFQQIARETIALWGLTPRPKL